MKPHDVAFTPEAEEQLTELYRYIEENAKATPDAQIQGGADAVADAISDGPARAG